MLIGAFLVKMVQSSQIFTSLTFVNFLLLVICGMTYGTATDIFCLKSIKDSLEDPYNYLQSWNFNNKTEGFICNFNGVECWHPDENRILNLKLSNMGLKGQFPLGIGNCTSLTGLDLSINNLSGVIPGNIATLLPYVTSLDLSPNKFSGVIPVGLANCSYLNTLKLDQNRLSGEIPQQLGLLKRLRTFTVSNNSLTGPVPNFTNDYVMVNYSNNKGLCGPSLRPCPQ
ncbi:inactive leucine-rich repeat receptor protein kinase [Spatholobus suberectus]|nr:inactive leucine-rich repeat receptor protein kinase [Spatholobus suberectus]